jgi:hypothetical protein
LINQLILISATQIFERYACGERVHPDLSVGKIFTPGRFTVKEAKMIIAKKYE